MNTLGWLAWTIACATAAIACGDNASRNDEAPEGFGESVPDSGGSSLGCTDLPKARGPSESCCQDYGVDACGANLFCAAFDGRTVAVCFVEGSQLPGKECKENAHCASQSCNLSTHRCRGVLGSACDETTGCVGSACYLGTCKVTAGEATSICDEDSQCEDGMKCVMGRCGVADGVTCQRGDDVTCQSRWCKVASDSNFGRCSACTSNADCNTAWATTFERCEGGRCVHTCQNDQHCQQVPKPNACVYVGSGCEDYTCTGGLCR